MYIIIDFFIFVKLFLGNFLYDNKLSSLLLLQRPIASEVKIVAELIDKYFNVRVKLRNDSHENWENKAQDFTPFDGEVVIYDINENYPIQLLKIGDGVHKIGELPFINDLTQYYTKIEIDEKVTEIYTRIDQNFSFLDNKIDTVAENSEVRLALAENGIDYNLYQGDNLVDQIIMPPDVYVSGGEIVEGNKIRLDFANKRESVIIDLSKLKDIHYFQFENASTVQVEIDQESRIIAANLLDESVNMGKLDPDLQQLIRNGIGVDENYDEDLLRILLANIAFTGNVNELNQYDNTYLILDCN